MFRFVHCPGCDQVVTIPDIGPRTPPGIEVVCGCGDAFGILYAERSPTLIWWRPCRPIVVRNTSDE